MIRNLLLLVGLSVVAAGCGDSSERDINAVVDVPPTPPASLQVVLAPTSGQTASGTLVVSDTTAGIRITGRLSGLPADRQLGFHLHDTGDCSAPDASSAGEHFNPTQQPHGGPVGTLRHAGDLPNLSANDEGVAEVDVTIEGVRIDAPASGSARRRALVVHAGRDDYKTQPAGDSGHRIACGVVGATSGL